MIDHAHDSMHAKSKLYLRGHLRSYEVKFSNNFSRYLGYFRKEVFELFLFKNTLYEKRNHKSREN